MVIIRLSLLLVLALSAAHSATALITFADLCFHSRIDHILCQKSIASPRYLNHFQPTQDFFAGLDPLIVNKLATGSELAHAPHKRGYDFIRFGRSPERQTKKAASTYDYIRFGRRRR